jgi:hypothetical protein
MKLQDKLNEMKARFESGLPAETRARMHQATDDLMQSGILENVLKKGAPAPTFILKDHQGIEVNSGYLIKKGPLVISFYRGVW